MIKTEKFAKAFDALAQNTRIQIFKMIVNSGVSGICPCDLIGKTKQTNANLSFHLRELENAGLVRKEKHGRFIHYYPECKFVEELGNFLITDCIKKEKKCLKRF